jgi:hypothetical protein
LSGGESLGSLKRELFKKDVFMENGRNLGRYKALEWSFIQNRNQFSGLPL